MENARKIALIIFAGLILTGMIYYLCSQSEFMRIDTCLDAGGRWMESEERCVFQ